ncbi:MAG: hypothetical protein EB084_25455 [Proteobacteria bacterium]|nr:hypothetical protein [Pseudomonadota bacterium]
MKYKIGDLVVPSNGMGCDLFSDEFAEVFPKSVRNPYTGIALMAGEIGTILEIKRINTNITSDNILKILAPTGIGWVYAHWVKVVK